MLGHRISHGKCSHSQSDYSGSDGKKRRKSGNNKDQFRIESDDKVARKRKACSTRSSDKLSILCDDDYAAYDYKNRKIIPEQREAYFPEDIVVEIIGRLPVKSILRFRCVSKHWNSIISSKRFVKVHLENSTRNPKFSHHNLISISIWKKCWSRPGVAIRKQLSLQSLLYDQNTYAADIYFPTVDPSENEYFRLIGSCNGLCCMIADKVHNFVLLNPSTTQYKTKLTYIYCIPENFYFNPDSYGFGMSDDGDYKLVCVGYLHHLISREQEPAGAWVIYTLKTNSWRMVRNRKYFRSQTSGHGLFMNGKIHWLVHDGRSIVSFDLGTETEGLVYPPNNVFVQYRHWESLEEVYV